MQVFSKNKNAAEFLGRHNAFQFRSSNLREQANLNRKQMKTSVKTLVTEANQKVKTYDASEAVGLLKRDDVLFVDVRDMNELMDEGKIPGAVHASRGMLEFYIDPESPYHKKELASDKEIVFYCKSSGRSAMAAQRAQEMGLNKVAHIGGGFNAWKEKGGPVERLNK